MRSTFKLRNGLLAGLIVQAAAITAVATTPVFAADVAFTAPASLVLDVPTTAATSTCTLVPATAATTKQTLSQTFIDNFNTLDLTLANGWSPHYDGGYDEAAKKFLGYDWPTKRTLAGNAEQQVYVDSGYAGKAGKPMGLNPFSTVKGVLHIIAQKTPPELMQYVGNAPYTSGVLTTRKSMLQRYGYFEMNAKLPTGQGMWPAFWLLNVDREWPPEIDVMEAPSNLVKLGQINAGVHWKDATGAKRSSGCRPKVAVDSGFHLYGVLWSADRIVYYIDRKPVGQIITPLGVNRHMYMLINLAVGGNWPGNADATTPIPADMQVEWVTAYMNGSTKTCGVVANGAKQCPLQ